MKNKILFFLFFLFFQTVQLHAQNGPTDFENPSIKDFTLIGDEPSFLIENMVPTPPPLPVRTMAEWEELQAIVITWRPETLTGNTIGRIEILRQIVKHAKEEVNVIIVCENQATVKVFLNAANISWDNNVTFVETNPNSIWVRDYGPNTVYAHDVEEQYFVDWIYNRPRPMDDIVPDLISDELGLPIYTTTVSPLDLVHTGGNFMTDGMGTAFSSKLILDENDTTNTFGESNHSEGAIDTILNQYMGINLGRYVKMEKLTFDSIDHIDMHMKLLDEETLLVGEYPEGIADGPQIEANLQYILDNYQTPFGNPYEVIRIPMPPDSDGMYPNVGADYRTYTNSLIINKTILVPFYEEQYDTIAQRIWEELMPGFKVVGIDCNAIINSLGAIHCITKEVGIADPLLINHAKIREGCENSIQKVEAFIQHQYGIESATLFYSIDTAQGYEAVPMISDFTTNKYIGEIPAQQAGTKVFYYINAVANNGKEINRPIPAPKGYFHYKILPSTECTVSNGNILLSNLQLKDIYPNPTNSVSIIPVVSASSIDALINVTDVLGREIETIFYGKLPSGESNYSFDTEKYAAGTYFVSLKTDEHILVQKLVVKK